MTRPHVYRNGDVVKIVEPKFIDRVGYPVRWDSLVPDFRQHPKMLEAMKLLGMIPDDQHMVGGRAALAFAQGCAKAQNELNGFGGRLRSLHYWDGDFSQWAGMTAKVSGKRIAKTGEYYAPSGGRFMTDYGYEYEYANGGLEDQKTHILLRLDIGYEIEACHVELIEAVAE